MTDKIAVIDDDEVYQMIISRYIEKSGVYKQAEYYQYPKEALKYYTETKENLPSVMLLDINMPLMDGWQFLEALQSRFPNVYNHTRIYIVTSSIAYSDRERFENFPGLAGFLSKPLNVDKLRELGGSED